MVPFNPNDHVFHSKIISDLVQEAINFFTSTQLHHFPPAKRFNGTGVYALYFVGTSGMYRTLGKINTARDQQIPIYVGQASSSGIRQGKTDRTGAAGWHLHRRLGEHRRSIRQAKNLHLEDFRCRLMIMVGEEHGLIRTIESALIRKYKPLWNTYVDGFGIHAPGKGRARQQVSEWDSIHPGRPFVEKMESEGRPIEPILAKIKKVLETL